MYEHEGVVLNQVGWRIRKGAKIKIKSFFKKGKKIGGEKK